MQLGPWRSWKLPWTDLGESSDSFSGEEDQLPGTFSGEKAHANVLALKRDFFNGLQTQSQHSNWQTCVSGKISRLITNRQVSLANH